MLGGSWVVVRATIITILFRVLITLPLDPKPQALNPYLDQFAGATSALAPSLHKQAPL